MDMLSTARCSACKIEIRDTSLVCHLCGQVFGEPIFSRQEQGVVYLFSRYWHRIDAFRAKRIYEIHTHFPDFYLRDTRSNELEALEFEYCLSKFRDHLDRLEELEEDADDAVKTLYVVYWELDEDPEELRQAIRHNFTGSVELVSLHDYFGPVIRHESDRLRAFWEFTERRLPSSMKCTVSRTYGMTPFDWQVTRSWNFSQNNVEFTGLPASIRIERTPSNAITGGGFTSTRPQVSHGEACLQSFSLNQKDAGVTPVFLRSRLRFE